MADLLPIQPFDPAAPLPAEITCIVCRAVLTVETPFYIIGLVQNGIASAPWFTHVTCATGTLERAVREGVPPP